ncbi:MAG: serine/threonine protein kinase [Planctomycetes bacterium]|nr:serine/threonine protein kinase [Planctomycetota bacterium]
MGTQTNESRFGDLIIQAGFATRQQVDECLIQKRSEEQSGRFRQLGAIMVERGLLTADDVQLILRAQGKKVLVCEACRSRFNVVGYSPEKVFRCLKCGGNLAVPPDLKDVGVDGSPVTEAAGAPPVNPDNLEGQVLCGCKVLQKIAIGGMGSIYKGRQLSMSRDVAVKVLSDELSKDRAYVQRFILEARAAGELSHTNLIHVIDVGTHDGLYYYVMEYVEGEGLDAVLERRGQLDPDESLNIALQTASALEHAHKHGIIHRDIKPDNLILMKDGTVKVADLGIAKKISIGTHGLTQPGMVLGTPFYMAPEQGKDSRLVDARSDIYALGASVYHMLTGKVPFDGKTCLEVVLKAIDSEPVPIRDLNPSLPDGLVAVVEKMMKKKPEDRYQNTGDLMKDLHRLKAGVEPLLGLAAPVPKSSSKLRASPPAPPAPAPPSAPQPVAAAPAAAPPPRSSARAQSQEKAQRNAHVPAGGSAPAAAPAGASSRRRSAPVAEAPLPAEAAGPPAAPAGPATRSSHRPPGSRRDNPLAGAHAGAGRPSAMDDARSPLNPFARADTTRINYLIPAVTLAGALACGLLAYYLFFRGESPSSTGDDNRPKPVHPVGQGEKGPNAPAVSDPVEAIEDLRKAQAYEESHPTELPKSIADYEHIAGFFPSTQSAERARTKVAELSKKREQLLQENYQQVEQLAAGAEAKGEYGPVLTALDDFLQHPLPPAWQEKAQNRKVALFQAASEVFQKADEAAIADANAGDPRKALDRYDGLKNLGVPELVARVEDRVLRLEARLEADTSQAEVIVRSDFIDNPEVHDFFVKRQFDKIAAKLSSLEKDPKTTLARALLAFQRRVVDGSIQFLEGFRAGVQGSVGQPGNFKYKTMVLAGEIVGIDKTHVSLKAATGQVSRWEIMFIALEDVLKYARKGLGQEKADSQRLAALFFLGQGMLKEAKDAVAEAEKMGGDVSVEVGYLRDLDMAGRLSGWINLADGGFGRWNRPDSFEYRFDKEEVATSDRKAFSYLLEAPWTSYVYSLRFKKLRGLNGLLVTFPAFGRNLVWALGEEGNAFSIVRGIPSTQQNDQVENGRWYGIKVRVMDGVASGYLNGERKWELREADVSPTAASADGMGFGAAATEVVVRDLRLNPIR